MAKSMGKAVHAYLSDEAFGGWQEFAEISGVSKSGLVEMLGLYMNEDVEMQTVDVQQWVLGARRIDAARRRR